MKINIGWLEWGRVCLPIPGGVDGIRYHWKHQKTLSFCKFIGHSTWKLLFKRS